MNKKNVLLIIALFFVVWGCKSPDQNISKKVRTVVDSIGFAKYNWQMDSILNRMNASHFVSEKWRVAITPHDDYAYVGNLYPKVLNGIQAKTVILFGVAHKARNFELEDQLIFDPFNSWSAPYGAVKVSGIRDKLIKNLHDSLMVIHAEMHSIEHSLEALIPFLQANNKDVEIIPILIPYMSYDRMEAIADEFATKLSEIMINENLSWGKDLSILITTDAVHYGDEDWGGSNYAPFGTDSVGLANARNHEMEIITNCLLGDINPEKIKKFLNYTVKEENYKEYEWTWCGRYSVPFGLLTAYYLSQNLELSALNGEFIGYSTSIDHEKLKVDDLNMGTTAPANNHHFVGYAAIGYK